MPKATLSYDLADPDERAAHRDALDGWKWKLLVQELLDGGPQSLRHWLKYGHDFKTADDALEAVRRIIYESMEEDGLGVD